MIEVRERADGFDVLLAGTLVIAHRRDRPFLALGRGEPSVRMVRGNFDISDRVAAREEVRDLTPSRQADGWRFAGAGLALSLRPREGGAVLRFEQVGPATNRVWLSLEAEPGEHVWGGGEQMSYLDLRGRRFPLWTSEPGVGRDKTTPVTRAADAEAHAGGDYWTTNYPQPTLISSRGYAAHLATTAYSVFDFTAPDRHALEVWDVPELELFAAPDFAGLVRALSARFGQARGLPDWILSGVVVGLKQGVAGLERLERTMDAGVEVAALWAEDWAGVRETSFGTRLSWNWRWDERRYPDLPGLIAGLPVRFMGYCNPYLAADGDLFGEAEQAQALATGPDGRPYRVDFGEFDAGLIDFTSPAAARWFEHRVLRQNMLDIGMAGWMADFGEYLPVDAGLAHGDPMRLHNDWPRLWAAANADAIGPRDAVFFMRAGFTGVQAHCPLLWAGDQCVDFSRHDGLGTTICGALSAGLLGNRAHHSDIGGYTSLFGVRRTPELLMRWIDLAAFTPVMRTHEGNRPAENLQVDQDPAVLTHLARLSRVHRALLPYVQAVLADAGLPAQRALFLGFPADPRTYVIQDAYLYGPDLLVAPVTRAGAERWPVYLPSGADWVELWGGGRHRGGQDVVVPAPFGRVPAFWRAGSAFEAVFASLGKM